MRIVTDMEKEINSSTNLVIRREKWIEKGPSCIGLVVDTIVVVSEYMADVLMANLSPLRAKIKLLPRQVRKPASQRPAKQGQLLHLAYISRIGRKGLHVALKALTLLPWDIEIKFSIARVIENAPFGK